MTAALEGGDWSAARPGRTLHTGKTRYPFYRGLGGPQAGLDGRKFLSPPGFDHRTVQPVAQLLYRLSYPAHLTSHPGNFMARPADTAKNPQPGQQVHQQWFEPIPSQILGRKFVVSTSGSEYEKIYRRPFFFQLILETPSCWCLFNDAVSNFTVVLLLWVGG